MSDAPRIKMAFAHLCDFAGLGNNGKPIIVGIFDAIQDREQTGSVTLGLAFFITKIEASLVTGTAHDVSIVVQTADMAVVHRVDFGKLEFQSSGPGRPLAAQIILPVLGMPFPGMGDYTFAVIVDGVTVGEAPLYVVPSPPA